MSNNMEVYITSNTACRSGGALNGNLRYLSRFISQELNKNGFQSSFDEFSVRFAYPPMYVLPGVVSLVTGYREWYDSLPYSRLDRRYKKIEVSLQTPEFSEHFDKEEQSQYEHTFEIEEEFKNISEIDLAKVAIDKLIIAANIVDAKLKKDDDFDISQFEKILINIKDQITPQFLQKNHEKQAVEVENQRMSLALENRENRRVAENIYNKRIKDLRIYEEELPLKFFTPYNYQYSEIFLNLLSHEDLMCPNYDHIYLKIAPTEKEALLHSFGYDFYQVGIAFLDDEKYEKSSEKIKEEMFLQATISALKDIAGIDRLDLEKIDRVINIVKEKGLDIELIYRCIENAKFHLKITYFPKTLEEGSPVFLNITNKATQQIKRIEIGRIDYYKLHLWLQKITMTQKKITIKSSDSIRGQVWLKGNQTFMEFDLV